MASLPQKQMFQWTPVFLFPTEVEWLMFTFTVQIPTGISENIAFPVRKTALYQTHFPRTQPIKGKKQKMASVRQNTYVKTNYSLIRKSLIWGFIIYMIPIRLICYCPGHSMLQGAIKTMMTAAVVS